MVAIRHTSEAVPVSERNRANTTLLRHLETTMNEGDRGLRELGSKLNLTYYVVVLLSVVMFVVGVGLLCVPLVQSVGNGVEAEKSLVPGGLGIVDLVTLFMFKPIERIRSLMGDMSQITMALNSFQTQLGLRLLQMRADMPETIGRAADDIQAAARKNIVLVQDYFETGQTKE